jgi:hypothetical protein
MINSGQFLRRFALLPLVELYPGRDLCSEQKLQEARPLGQQKWWTKHDAAFESQAARTNTSALSAK